MDLEYEQAIIQAASLAFHLASIENVLNVAVEFNEFSYMTKEIRWHIQQAERVAGDDLARSRRIIHGDYSR